MGPNDYYINSPGHLNNQDTVDLPQGVHCALVPSVRIFVFHCSSTSCSCLMSLYVADRIQSTIGIDQDLWCYAKGMNTEGGSQHTAIAFYAWDLAGEASYHVMCTVNTRISYRRNTLQLISALSLKIHCTFCAGKHATERKAFLS